jgi:hypothetical protein
VAVSAVLVEADILWRLSCGLGRGWTGYARYLNLAHGVPSHDMFRRLLGSSTSRITTSSMSCSGIRLTTGLPGLTVLPIQQLAHRLTAGFVRFFRILVLGAAHAAFCRRLSSVSLAARRTPIRKAGFVRLELKLFCANSANFNGKGHAVFRIQRAGKCVV